jgi:hypothetical protein
MYTGRRPYESLIDPKKLGVMAWKMRYTVTASDMSCSER